LRPYFLHGHLVPISVIAEKTRYSTSKLIPARKDDKFLVLPHLLP